MSDQTTGSKHKGGFLSGLFGGGRTIWAAAIVMALLAMGGTLSILGSITETTTYYVLGRDVPARTQITEDMLLPVETKQEGAPVNALDAVYVRDNEVFSQYALSSGDIVTPSNSGPLTRITENVPDNFVAASFTAEPELVVAGKVRAGDHIDIIANSSENSAGTVSKVVLQHVLVLDVTVAPTSIAAESVEGQEGEEVAAPGPESEAVRSGIPSVYTVALNQTDATKLALVRTYDLFVVLSANLPSQDSAAEAFQGDVFSGPVGDSSEGSFDSVFVKRYEVAFEPGNTYVDAEGALYRVNAEGVWEQYGKGEPVSLGENALPVGYLRVPVGLEFTDTEGNYHYTALPEAGFSDQVVEDLGTSAEWVNATTGERLSQGEFPQGYDPRAGFDVPVETTD